VNVLELTALVGLVSVAAGFLGALTGLGGGVVITPAMVLLLGIDLHYAMGAALISVIATSSGAAAAYVREGFSNIRIGMFLEIATTVGARPAARTPLKTTYSVTTLSRRKWQTVINRGKICDPRTGRSDLRTISRRGGSPSGWTQA